MGLPLFGDEIDVAATRLMNLINWHDSIVEAGPLGSSNALNWGKYHMRSARLHIRRACVEYELLEEAFEKKADGTRFADSLRTQMLAAGDECAAMQWIIDEGKSGMRDDSHEYLAIAASERYFEWVTAQPGQPHEANREKYLSLGPTAPRKTTSAAHKRFRDRWGDPAARQVVARPVAPPPPDDLQVPFISTPNVYSDTNTTTDQPTEEFTTMELKDQLHLLLPSKRLSAPASTGPRINLPLEAKQLQILLIWGQDTLNSANDLRGKTQLLDAQFATTHESLRKSCETYEQGKQAELQHNLDESEEQLTVLQWGVQDAKTGSAHARGADEDSHLRYMVYKEWLNSAETPEKRKLLDMWDRWRQAWTAAVEAGCEWEDADAGARRGIDLYREMRQRHGLDG
ncbi:hypothetical protein S40293_10967 [Stachybotrys chartarum IBT 40293]|nr:hypothetical protein S40293_10967 [Stachybotrys chartarum IBT 40293]